MIAENYLSNLVYFSPDNTPEPFSFFAFSWLIPMVSAVSPAILPSCMVSTAELGTITIVEFCFNPS